MSAPEMQILAKICSRDPSFKPKKSVPGDSTFENLGGTYLPKIFLSTPLATVLIQLINFRKHQRNFTNFIQILFYNMPNYKEQV